MTKKTPKKEEAAPVAALQTQDLSPGDAKEARVIERIIENRQIAPSEAFRKLTRPQVELLKRTVAKGASDDELKMFLQVCVGARLNPFLKQVHLVPRWDSKIGAEVRAIQVGIDGFRAVAESSGKYAGQDDVVYGEFKELTYTSKKGEMKIMVPTEAKVTVYKIVEGGRYPFPATVYWDEYYPGEKMGFQWHIRPRLMLGKCAEALALRKAFPTLLSGMYAQEELDRSAGENADEKRKVKGFESVLQIVAKSSKKELEEYREKMEKSDKYTEDQKAEFIEAVDKRLQELSASDEKVADEQK